MTGKMPGMLSGQRLLVGLIFATIGTLACVMPAGPDTYWHLRAGEEIWSTLRVPLVDRYSFTAAGRPWPNHEWLWQAISFGLMRLGGFKLLTLAGAGFVIAAFAIVYRLMVGPPLLRFLIMLLGLPIASCMWTLRPQLLSLILLASLLHLLVAERHLALPFLFALWANAHGVVAMGGAVLGAVAIASVVRARSGNATDRRRAAFLCLLVPMCGAATLLTPLGRGLWDVVRSSIAFSRQTGLSEWQPAYPNTPFAVLQLGLAAAFVWVLVWRRRRFAMASWADQVLVVTALVLLPLAFYAIRNAPMFLVAAIPATSRLLGADFRIRLPGWADAGDRPAVNVAFLGAVSVTGAVVVMLTWAGPHPRLEWRPISRGAIDAELGCPANVYNHYNDGGYLIWFARGKPVFVDGRQDPYPLSLVLEHIAVENGAPYRSLFERYEIGCAILRIDSYMRTRLELDGWRRRFADERWVVLSAPELLPPG